MQIIKITPRCFKAILSKNDLGAYGEKDLSDYKWQKALLCRVISKARQLYGSEFSKKNLYAEFFQSKDGGGEIFITSKEQASATFVYLFKTQSFENLVLLCKRLYSLKKPVRSSLYLYKGNYCLTVFGDEKSTYIKNILAEYGSAELTSQNKMLHIAEFGKKICANNAVSCFATYFV